jgi:hypothetical protein
MAFRTVQVPHDDTDVERDDIRWCAHACSPSVRQSDVPGSAQVPRPGQRRLARMAQPLVPSPSPQGPSDDPTLPQPAPLIQTALQCQRRRHGGATG